MKYYKCGNVMTTHGLKGDLKVKNLSDFDRFFKGSRLFIKHHNDYVEVVVKKATPFGNYLLVQFENLEDINLVQKYHGDDIFVSELDRTNGDLEEGEYYYSDLIGKEVVNQDGLSRGKVLEIRELPQAEYLVVSYNDKKHMIPFIKEFVIKIDDKITINEIEGLF